MVLTCIGQYMSCHMTWSLTSIVNSAEAVMVHEWNRELVDLLNSCCSHVNNRNLHKRARKGASNPLDRDSGAPHLQLYQSSPHSNDR